jgi:hypothetical protein
MLIWGWQLAADRNICGVAALYNCPRNHWT